MKEQTPNRIFKESELPEWAKPIYLCKYPDEWGKDKTNLHLCPFCEDSICGYPDCKHTSDKEHAAPAPEGGRIFERYAGTVCFEEVEKCES